MATPASRLTDASALPPTEPERQLSLPPCPFLRPGRPAGARIPAEDSPPHSYHNEGFVSPWAVEDKLKAGSRFSNLTELTSPISAEALHFVVIVVLIYINYYSFIFKIFIGVELIYNVALVSGVPLSESVIYLHAYVLNLFSRFQLFATPWTVARRAPLSMRFSRQEYWSGLTCPLPGDLPNLRSNPCLLHLLQWQTREAHTLTYIPRPSQVTIGYWVESLRCCTVGPY